MSERGASFCVKSVLNTAAMVAHNTRSWSEEYPAPSYLLDGEHSRGHWRSYAAEDPAEVIGAKWKLASGRAKASREFSPAWDGVLNLDHPTGDHAIDRVRYDRQIARFVRGYEQFTGQRVLAVDVHLDEGRLEGGQPIYNAHAHVVIDRTDRRGRVIRLDREKLRHIQDLAAEATGLARGEDVRRTKRRHIDHREYRGLARAGGALSREDRAAARAAELYAELRGVLKASGKATQADYHAAKVKRHDVDWLEERCRAELQALGLDRAGRPLRALRTGEQMLLEALKKAERSPAPEPPPQPARAPLGVRRRRSRGMER